ncbi:hypothetical protein BDD43_3838 [Mucilaginibacter gracilis]|uniref:Uncharacterized protein n=1 Tax=Mucilaginibacter gracilis TaxID=423350 RepID=A0A495J3U5_9SPHI|nr:hypothetical protein [Mucilaginibacter gracilis]RKR83627.1 hypothetical protein BDD43_3838 [Mucilaginibacter gracilis]
MKTSPLAKILLKIFSNGFYKAHGGMFAFALFVMFGMVEPSQLLNYHKTLMLAFISSWLMMGLVFLFWLLYAVKCWHFVAGHIFALNQQFLFYSSTSYQKTRQFAAWFILQAALSTPILVYAFIAVGVGVKNHFYLGALAVLGYCMALNAIGAWFYMRLINKLIDGSTQSVILKLTKSWKKPYFSLYVYHILDKLKVKYLVTKALSYLIITGVFLMFADVSHDLRVAGIALLAVAVSHSVLIFDERQFEETFLVFSRTLPYSRLKLFLSFLAVYLILLSPEAVWLFVRFSPLMALGLLAFALSLTLLFHSLLYKFGLDMEKYITWVLALFIVLFWVVMFRLIWGLVCVNLLAAYVVFFRNYYKNHQYTPPAD